MGRLAMKKILAGLGFVLVLLVSLPVLMTWNQYKSLVQSEFRKATGRELVIDGDVRIGILPSPYARITNAAILNPAGAATKHFVTVKSLDVGVALFPLLRKDIQVKYVTIVSPAVTLETMANGQNNWTMAPQGKTPSTDRNDDSSNNNDDDATVSVDSLTVENGFVRVVNVPNKSQSTIGPIEGTFAIADLAGPMSGRGSVTVMDKLPLRFELNIESIPRAATGLVPLRGSVALPFNAGRLEFKGAVQKGDRTTARIETTLAVSDLAKILGPLSANNAAPDLPPVLQGKISASGLLEMVGEKISLNNLVIKTAIAEMSGGIDVTGADGLDVAIDIDRVRLAPQSAGVNSASVSAKTVSSHTLAHMLRDLFSTSKGFLDSTLPKNKMGVVLTVSQWPLENGTTLRDLRLAASAGPAGLSVQTLEGKLPGNTFFKLGGAVPVRPDGKAADATFTAQVTSQNIKAAAGTTGAKNTPFNLKTTARLTRDAFTLSPFDILQDTQAISGSVIYKPDTLNIKIKGGTLDLDALSAKPKNTEATSNTATKPVEPAVDPLEKLAGLTADIHIDLARIVLSGKNANNIAVDAILGADGLHVKTARIGDLGGLVVNATGKIGRLAPLGAVNLSATAKTNNLSATLRALGNARADNLGASSFDATLSGGASGLDVALDGTIDQGKITVKGKATNMTTAPSFDGMVDITHPETATIMRNFAGLNPVGAFGPFLFKAAIGYGPDRVAARDLMAKLGSAGTLQGHVDMTASKIDVKLGADTLDLAGLVGDDAKTPSATTASTGGGTASYGWSRDRINLDGLRTLNGKADVTIGKLTVKKFVINNLQTNLTFANGTVTANTLKGGLFDAGQFSINGKLAAGAPAQPHRGDVNITISKTDAAKLFAALGSSVFAEGMIDMTQKLAFSGQHMDGIMRSLDGDGTLSLSNGVINGIDLDGLAAKLDRPKTLGDFAAIMDQARIGGQTRIGNLKTPLVIRSGVLKLDNIAVNTQKTAMAVAGTANLGERNVNMAGQIRFTEQRNLPPMTLYVQGPLDNPQKNFDTRAFTQFYANKATEKLQEKAVEKINDLLGVPKQTKQPAAMPPRLAPTENEDGTGSGVTAPTRPTPPTMNDGGAARPQPQNPQDALKDLGGQLLNNILNQAGQQN